MVIKRTKVSIFDNSGALVVRCIRVRQAQTNRPAKLGDQIQGSVFQYKAGKKVKRKGLYPVLLVTSRRPHMRLDGSSIRFDQTRGVLVQHRQNLEPLGTRVFTPRSKELKRRSLLKLTSLSRGSV